MKTNGNMKAVRSKRNSFRRDAHEQIIPNQSEIQHRENREDTWNVLLRNKRDVWPIPTQSYRDSHFATYPEKLVEPCILAGTSARGHCPACGSPWVRIIEENTIKQHEGKTESNYPKGSTAHRLSLLRQEAREHGEEYSSKKETTSWQPTCQCNAGDPVPQIVLDPFSGSGTTGRVAARLNRAYVGIELNPEYLKLHPARMTVQTQITDW